MSTLTSRIVFMVSIYMTCYHLDRLKLKISNHLKSFVQTSLAHTFSEPMMRFEVKWVRHLMKDCSERFCHTETVTLFNQSNLFDVRSICVLISLITFTEYCPVLNRTFLYVKVFFCIFYFMLHCKPVFLVVMVFRVRSHDLL